MSAHIAMTLVLLAAVSAVTRQYWGQTNGDEVWLYTLRNANGAEVQLTNFGARITALKVPDREGQLADVILGFDKLEDYMAPNPSFGATIGRYANRIRNGRFEIDGKQYQLSRNEGPNQLHGGGEFENAAWDSEPLGGPPGPGVRFTYFSPDGSQGFPGNLEVTADYRLTESNAVHITFEARTDQATHVNITQHSYFNLNGMQSPVFDHLARIHADEYLEMDGVLATGAIGELAGKPWNLADWARLGDAMQDIPLGGYHHDYVSRQPAGELALIAEVRDPSSGRSLNVYTTQPGVVFYTGMGLDGSMRGKAGKTYGPYMGFCLETQHHIDAANHAGFPSTLLRPGETYRETVVYEFGVKP